jgi:hypothetical protein
MKDFKAIWKAKAASKTITTEDVITHAILRTMAAKSRDKRDILRHFITRAFREHKTQGWQALIHACNVLKYRLTSGERYNPRPVLGSAILDIFESDSELQMFLSLLDSLSPYDFDRVYTYVFVRQDISPEYQLVQAAHATMALGKALAPEHDPHNTYFTVVGVPDPAELKNVEQILKANNFPYEKFIEPDIKTGSQVTAIATHPIHWAARRPLKGYPLLSFAPKELEIYN